MVNTFWKTVLPPSFIVFPEDLHIIFLWNVGNALTNPRHIPAKYMSYPRLVCFRLQLKCDGTGDAREGKWRGNGRMEWVASTLHTLSEHGVSSINTANAHTSAASSRLNWRTRRDLNGIVRFAERRNLVSARVQSHFNWPLPFDMSRTRPTVTLLWRCCLPNKRNVHCRIL